jgi:hypothetical protein
MSQASPGFAMASNLMKDSQGPPMNMGPPPAPVETKSMPFNGQRPGNNTQSFQSNRPDIALGRGASMPSTMPSMQPSVPAPLSGRSEPNPRQEMRGPSTDIDSILSGLKTKIVEPPSSFSPPPPQPQPPVQYQNEITPEYGMDSMISVSSLKDMQDGTLPKRTRRRNNNSRGNTVSLDI